jgi:uncharacterized protein YcbX
VKIAAIWRYPVKSMAGEQVTRAELTATGLTGDRIVQVYDGAGRVATARMYPRLLQLHATIGPDGEPLVDGMRWDAPEITRRVQDAVGPGASLERFEGIERFDVLPLLVGTDGAAAEFGRDVRRLRPNLLIAGVEVLAEREWPGRTLRLPHGEIRLASLRTRCVMTTYDPDTINQDRGVLRDIVRRFDGRLFLDAEVTQAGLVEQDDSVELI